MVRMSATSTVTATSIFLTSSTHRILWIQFRSITALCSVAGQRRRNLPVATSDEHVPGGCHFVQNAVADFNLDGRTDVLIGGEEYATATVALGNADGTFTPMNPFNTGIGLSGYWVTTEVGDINGDGKIDLLFVNGESGNGSSVLLGNGDGTTFANPIPYNFGPGTYQLQGHTLADFNGDGLADLAGADRFAGVVVHMNAGGWSPPRRICESRTRR